MTNTITTNSDELAYAPAHELAARIRRRINPRQNFRDAYGWLNRPSTEARTRGHAHMATPPL
jgi:hypothetical protein